MEKINWIMKEDLEVVKKEMISAFPDKRETIESFFMLDDLRLSVINDGQWELSGITHPDNNRMQTRITIYLALKEDGGLSWRFVMNSQKQTHDRVNLLLLLGL